MKPIIKKLWMLVAMLCASISATAYDFEVDGIAYTITSLTDLTVSVDQLVNKDVTTISIPESVVYKNRTLNVTSIKDNAFKGNTTLSEVSLPNTINSIGNKAFMNDSSLVAINTPHSLSYIGPEVFSGCSSITTFHIPAGIEQIPYRAFYGCKSLKSIELNASINSIGEAAFCESGLQSIVIPSSVVSIGRQAFANSKLVEIKLHDGTDTIPPKCFMGCSELQKISFSSKVIEYSAFENCISLKEINLPKSLTTIGGRAFYGCKNLKEIAIPSSVTKIEPTILWECPNLETLKIGSGLKGLPIDVIRDPGREKLQYYSLGCCYYIGYWGNNMYSGRHLGAVRKFIIEDSDEEFSLKGDYYDKTATPPFINTDLEHYYVGRPLVDIKDWGTNGDPYYSFWCHAKMKQGTGRINKLEISGKCTSVPYFYQKIDTLKLGANIINFDLSNIYKEDLAKIECLSVTPPTCTSDSNFPNKVYIDAILCVPSGCREAYANAEVWKNFWNIYEVDSKSGITEISNDEDIVLYHVYNIAGLLIGESYTFEDIKQLPNGIYILVNKSKRYKIKI